MIKKITADEAWEIRRMMGQPVPGKCVKIAEYEIKKRKE